MLTHAMQIALNEYFDMNNALYRESQSYVPMNFETWKNIRDVCNQAKAGLSHFHDESGVVVIDESNIDILASCIDAITLCSNGQVSWHRNSLVLIVYRFLSYFEWEGSKPEYEILDSWGPLIYELSHKQLAYYLWWRKEASQKIYHEATAEYIWLYIYELLLNVNSQRSSNETLILLESIYCYYKESFPRPIHKRLTVKKLGHLIVNYSLYNGLYDFVEELGNKYGIDDDYPLYQRFSAGKFNGLGRYLLGFASSDVKTKSFVGSEEELYACKAMPLILEKIYQRNNALKNLLISDICGKLDQHACWDFYETPVLSPVISPLLSKGAQKSFSINGNRYQLATGDTYSSDQEYANNQYSWFYNDRGDRFHISGFYYRKQYSGITAEGKLLIDYLLREIQIHYRQTNGMRTLKGKVCPYSDYTQEINECVRQGSEYCDSSEAADLAEDNIYTIKRFSILDLEDNRPAKFKYIRKSDNNQKIVLSGHNDDTSIDCLDIPDEVEEISAMSFAGCTNLETVIGGFGLKRIGVGAFYECTNLRTVVLQDGIECIEDGAFLGCMNLEEIFIPTSVHKIGDYTGPFVFEGQPVILCEKYSRAYYYAVEHNLQYKITNENL